MQRPRLVSVRPDYGRTSLAPHRINTLRDNRFRLVTLGRLTLVGADGEEDASLARRRSKLALLAMLALARRPIARDTLLAMFWGEQDEARARHSLSNALSSLRRALGQRAITTREAEVALATDVQLDVDALELTNAAEARDAGRVVELYGGPFLDGVYVAESAAFEQWVSRERRRLEALFVAACTQQCAHLARGRRWEECGALATRWLDCEPLAADAALFRLNAIKAPGTRAALVQALDEYRQLREHLAREFELAPEPVVAELAQRIQDQLAAMPAPPPEVESAVAPATAADSCEAAPAAEVHAEEEAPEPPASLPPARASSIVRRRTPLAAAGVVALAAGIATVALAMVTRRPPAPAASEVLSSVRKPVIAVLAADVHSSDSTLAWLADGLPQMILRKLAHNGEVDVTPASQTRAVLLRSGRDEHAPLDDDAARDLARRVGATLVARGRISRDDASLVLELTVQDVGTGRLLRNDVLTRGDVLSLADAASARILGAANVDAPGPRLAELETSSLEAYQHYVRALEAGQAGRFSESQHRLDAAIALDSGFISAVRTRLGWAIASNDMTLARRLRQTAQRYAARYTEFDRLEQETLDAHYGGERERSEALGRGLVRRYPRDPRAHQLLESILATHGEFAEAERVALQALTLDSLALAAGTGPCAQCVGFANVVGIHWARGDLHAAADWARRWIRAQPDAALAWESLAWTFSFMQQPDSALPLMQRAVSLSGGDSWARDELARMLLVARRYDAADSAIRSLEAAAMMDPERVYDLGALLERERGRFRAATAVMDRLVSVAPDSRSFAEMIRADNLRSLGDYAGATRRFAALTRAPGQAWQLPIPPGSARAFCWHTVLAADASAAMGDTIRLRATADTLAVGCTRSYYGRDWRLYHHLRGLVAMQGGHYADAERELEQAVWISAEGWARTTVALAKAQAALGRPRDAIATLRTAYSTRLDAMARYVPISELDYWMARMFAQAGEADSARTYASYVRRAWRDADPEVRRRLVELP